MSDAPDLEQWREVNERYLVSDQGRVWSERSKCFMTPSRDAQGYMTVTLDRRTRRVHLLVLEAFIGPRPDRSVGRHLNDTPADNRLANLAWGSRRQNWLDAVRNDRVSCRKGSNNRRSRLSEADVMHMRALRDQGWTTVDLGRRFGVSQTAASHATIGRSWAHV